MEISVIMSTYNAPDWLEKAIHGYACQHFRDFELVIADDGSGDETARRLQALAADTGLSMQHVWQRDDGFRKCRILNKAILHARHGYLVFTDGDCIPRADFLAVHAARAQRGCSLSGSYFKLPMATSRAITREDIASGRCFEWRWLRAHGLQRSAKRLKIDAGPGMARWLNRLTPTRCNFKGSNASAWLEDVLAVNGFDERMHYGGEDRELGVRLANSGVRPVHVRYDAVVVHLDHPRGYRDPLRMAENKALRQDVARRGLTRTPAGIHQLLDDGYPLPEHGAARRYL